jgi:(2R)-ethylmalonyl-CoA mutase
VLDGLRAEGLAELPVVVGGIIPPADAAELLAAGVAHVFTPRDYDPIQIMATIVDLVAAAPRAVEAMPAPA